ncbi:MAG: NADH-quinone oxidoreductase subunit N [Gemmatimonadetes bacterium]|nr:NADH-quinone oxidoreductase subunit N [Gemmatimonadota bacterium]
MRYDLLIPSQLMGAMTPDLLLMGGAMVMMLVAAWRTESDDHQRTVGWGSLVVLAATLGAVLWFAFGDATAGQGVIAVDKFRWAADVIFLLAAMGTVALGMDHNTRDGITHAESHVLVLFATSGMMIMAAARDLMILFLGLEMMSIAVYVLAGMNRRSERSAEGALKYFLLGAFATGFLLYGIALVYGATGSTNTTEIGTRIMGYQLHHTAMLLVGVGLLLVGFGFKVAAVPFHMWSPDVYEGAPTPITAFMASAVKAAAFAGFFRVWIDAFSVLDFAWFAPVWWLASITMLVGNVVALAQRNIKRMLAYSSIAHSGYLLVAIETGTHLGAAAFLFYLIAYTLATFGAFAIVATLTRVNEQGLDIADYDGLWTVRPWLATAMAVCMLALLGFPIFGGVGFFAKWYLLQAALSAEHMLIPLAVLLVLTSVVSAGYYLGVVRAMFMKPRAEGAPEIAPTGKMTRLVLGITIAAILGLGVFPGRLARWTRQSVPVPPAAAAATATGQTASR